MTAGLVSALLGALLALAQDDLKRLLAYDTISQVGIMAVGLGAGDPAGLAGAVYHLINHALFKPLLFLCAGAIVHRTGATKLSEMGGLARRMPVITAAFLLGAASIAGIPPLNGYVSVSLIHQGLQQQHGDHPVPAHAGRAGDHHRSTGPGGVAGVLQARPGSSRREASSRANSSGRGCSPGWSAWVRAVSPSARPGRSCSAA